MVGKVDFSDWSRAVQLVSEGNVKLDEPSESFCHFTVIGEHDSYTVGVDMESRDVGGCTCGDKTYNRVEHCYHELAVFIAMGVLGSGKDSEIKEQLFEDSKLFAREKGLNR